MLYIVIRRVRQVTIHVIFKKSASLYHHNYSYKHILIQLTLKL